MNLAPTSLLIKIYIAQQPQDVVYPKSNQIKTHIVMVSIHAQIPNWIQPAYSHVLDQNPVKMRILTEVCSKFAKYVFYVHPFIIQGKR